MRQILVGLAALAAAACASARPAAAPRPGPTAPVPGHRALSDAIEPQAVLQAMTRVAHWQLAHPSQDHSYDWQVAPFWAGLFAMARLSGDSTRYLSAIRENGEANQWQPGPRPFHADDYAITQSYFLLYTVEHDRRMIAPTLARFDVMLRAPFDESLDFSDAKTAREWVWCDALFMAPPALALATRVTGERAYTDLMNRLWWKTTDYLYDKEEHLYYRDGRFFDRREPNGEKVFWSRGNAWVLAGLARVLQYLPDDYPARPRYRALFREMATRVAGLQGQDGYWRASLLDPNSRPAPETSGTGFFTYALAWGVNEGLLDRATFEPVVQKGWQALVRAVQPNGMLGYVQRVGDRPGNTGPDDTEPYGVGAFLLAGSEVYRWAMHVAQ
jgi:unsaturated rhamnogalacturonyl hydrolase